jgi:lipoyl synthase
MTAERKPEWLRKKIDFRAMHLPEEILADSGLHTVCHQALCPNISECFARKTAAFMILGNICTRNCLFCNVAHGTPIDAAAGESENVADAVFKLGLQYSVITSVTRDDLFDGGASAFAEVTREIKRRNPVVKVELLVPDFKGSESSIKTVLDSAPDVFAHNIEMVPSLYRLRPGASYERSLAVLSAAKRLGAKRVKSGIMLGLGETRDEVVQTLKDIHATGCDYISIGQYIRPSSENIPVARYVAPDEFENLGKIAHEIGFVHAESAPYVRSSYMADRYS